MLQFRHEVKHEISKFDQVILRQRLGAFMMQDPHAIDGKYEIRSLYFDNPDDKVLREKIDGMYLREKYRIRLYNHDSSYIQLERKFKQGGLGYKQFARLSRSQTEAIVNGDICWMAKSENPVILGLYSKMRNEAYASKVIVDYTREPFIYEPGNVRVTIDTDIRTGLSCTDLLNESCVTVPAADSQGILEVKWDNFLPDVVRDAVQLGDRHSTAFSKYAVCRMYD